MFYYYCIWRRYLVFNISRMIHLYLVLVLVIVYWTYRLIQYKPGGLLSRIILGNKYVYFNNMYNLYY